MNIYKEKQRNKVLFDSKTSSVHSFMSLIPTFNHFVNIVQHVKWKQPTIGHILWDLNYLNCKRKSITQMSNMSGVDVRGFGDKLFKFSVVFWDIMGKSRNRWTFSKIENLRFLQNYDDYNCIFGIKLKGLSLSFIWRVMQ